MINSYVYINLISYKFQKYFFPYSFPALTNKKSSRVLPKTFIQKVKKWLKHFEYAGTLVIPNK